MFNKYQDIVIKILRVMEMILAGLLSVAIGVFTVQVIISAIPILSNRDGYFEFQTLLSNAFSLIIGIEFVKMICKPTMGNVIEVLLFAVARMVIIDHSTVTTTLLGVLSIAILFCIKKYLLLDDDKDRPREGAGLFRKLYDLHDARRKENSM